MIYEKPKNEIFASDAKDGEIVEFPNIKRGWGVTENLGFIPPMEYFNAAFNRVDKSLAYQLQRGVGEWDKDMEYPIGAVVSLNGIIYIAKGQNTNKNPSENKEIWHVITNKEWCEQTFLNKNEKIDAYNKKQTDDKFVSKEDIATETKAGITKLKNSITAKQEDVAVTEKAIKLAIDEIYGKMVGIGQTLQNVTSERQLNETYENTTGKPIYVLICGSVNYHSAPAIVLVNNIQVGYLVSHLGVSNVGQVSFFVPAGGFYRVKTDGTDGATVSGWLEQR